MLDLIVGILEWLETGKGTWMGFLTRETMENAQNYDEAQNMLANTLMIAPAFFILGGTKPGQVRQLKHSDFVCFCSLGWRVGVSNIDLIRRVDFPTGRSKALVLVIVVLYGAMWLHGFFSCLVVLSGIVIVSAGKRKLVALLYVGLYLVFLNYSRTSLSRTRLFRITAYLEEKIWSLF